MYLPKLSSLSSQITLQNTERMSHGMFSSAESQARFCNYITYPNNHQSPKSIFQPCSHISFNTHLSKQGFSLETHSKSHRFGSVKAATIDRSYVNTQSFYDLLGISAKGTVLLGISAKGTVSDIKQAYRLLARKYHPDGSPPERTEEYTKKFIKVQEAYETLSDPYSRALYDRDMARSLHLAFSSRKPFHYKEESKERSEWRRQWKSQITELQMRSMNQDWKQKASWGSRMRAQAGRQQAKDPVI